MCINSFKGFTVILYISLNLQEKFQSIIFCSKAYGENAKTIEQLWNECKEAMYSLIPKRRQLGFGDQVGLNVCTYTSKLAFVFSLQYQSVRQLLIINKFLEIITKVNYTNFFSTSSTIYTCKKEIVKINAFL